MAPAAKRTQEEYDADLWIVSDLWIQGSNCQQIADHIKSIRNYSLSRQSIRNMIVKLRKIQHEELAANHRDHCEEYVASMRHLMSHSWEQLHKIESTQSIKTTRRLVTSPGKSGKVQKTTFFEQIKKDKTGAADYLATIRWANAEIARVRGVYAPIRVTAAAGEFGQQGAPDGYVSKRFPVEVTIKTDNPLGEVERYTINDL